MDLTACDREPIHVPGSIQPHGALLAIGIGDLTVRSVSSNIAAFVGLQAADCLGSPVSTVLGAPVLELIGETGRFRSSAVHLGEFRTASDTRCDLVVHRSEDLLLIELEPSPRRRRRASGTLAEVQHAVEAFELSGSLQELWEAAAREVRRVTRFDRVMIYRFLGDGSGQVVAEAKAPALSTFMNHHFPASDIPKQARELYLRNRIRLIPDSAYEPVPMLALEAGERPIDMSDCALRSVSPIHLQYLRNMGVGASMSISIVKDGSLWGLIACHHDTPRALTYETRSVCSLLGSVLSDQVAAKVEAAAYRQRIDLRDRQDRILQALMTALSVDEALEKQCGDLLGAIPADGVVVGRGFSVAAAGVTPPGDRMPELLTWLQDRSRHEAYATDALAREYAAAAEFADAASGVLSVVLPGDDPIVLAWFRAEQIETVKWAGNPHKPMGGDAAGMLTPRKSFDLWEEIVRGRSREWSPAEIEAAGRFRDSVADLRQRQRVRDLNRQLESALAEKESLVRQKDLLIREVNHRVQNTLQLVRSLFHLQASASLEPAVKSQLEEAGRRLTAIGLVHRRLYRAAEIETVEFDRYLAELQDELVQSLGPEWREHIRVQAVPMSVPTDRVVTLALMTTELVINAVKYAYGGAVGPIDISVREASGSAIEIVVADRGRGMDPGSLGGFGTKLVHALAGQLKGEVQFRDNSPGTRAVAVVPRL